MAFATGHGSDENNYTVRRINLNTMPFPLLVAEVSGVFKFTKFISGVISGK